VPTVRDVTGTASDVVLLGYSDANCRGCNQYCIRCTAVVGTVMPTVREVTGTASDVVMLWEQ